MKRNKIISVCIALAMLFSIFIGTSLSSKADYTIGSEIITTKDLTFDTLPVGSPLPAAWGFGAAYTSALVTAGGAESSANFLDIPGQWQVLGIEERVGYFEAGKHYRFSLWAKGSMPYGWRLVMWDGTKDVTFDMKSMFKSPLSIDDWQKYSYDFLAPAGVGADVASPNGHFFFNLQTGENGLQIDNLSLKELFMEPTPTPDPNATPTPTPAPILKPAVPIISVITNLSDILKGTAASPGKVTVTIGTASYSVLISSGKWQIFLPNTLKAGTKITAVNKYNNILSATKSIYVIPYTPTVNTVKAKAIYIKGKATKSAVVYAKIGVKTFSAKVGVKGLFSIKVPAMKKGTYVSVRCKAGGQYSAYRKVKTV
ncbi:MAG: hypothetical protein WCL54_00625 [Clostridia bacterium]